MPSAESYEAVVKHQVEHRIEAVLGSPTAVHHGKGVDIKRFICLRDAGVRVLPAAARPPRPQARHHRAGCSLQGLARYSCHQPPLDLRGAWMARVSSPYDAMHRGLWIPHCRAGCFSPSAEFWPQSLKTSVGVDGPAASSAKASRSRRV